MQRIEIPVNCPVCKSKLELVNDQLFCRNISCEAQVFKKIEHFAKTLKIKGCGPATIAKLQLEDITQLFYLDQHEVAEQIGDKLAAKLLAEIENSKLADFATVLASFSIPLIGGTAAGKVAVVCSNPDEVTFDKCVEAGLGEKASNNLVNWLQTEYKEIKEFLPFEYKGKIESQPVGEKVVCITGKLSSFATKKEAAVALNAKGYQVTDNLTKTVDFLIDESNKSSTKRQKAKSYGIPVIENLIQFLN